MSNGQFETTGIKAPTVVSWIAGILSITVWLGWGALANRIERLESHDTSPMSEVVRSQFDTIERARNRIDSRLEKLEERLNAVEQRVRALEATQGRVPHD